MELEAVFSLAEDRRTRVRGQRGHARGETVFKAGCAEAPGLTDRLLIYYKFIPQRHFGPAGAIRILSPL